MAGILVIAETRGDALRDVTFELIGAGRELAEAGGGPLAVAVLDSRPDRFAPACGAAGVDEVLSIESPVTEFEPHVGQKALELLIAGERPQAVLLAHSVDSLGFAPAVAARSGTGFASDVTTLRWEDGPVAGRGAYGDKLAVELEFPGKDCTLLLLRPGAFAPPAGTFPPASERPVQLPLEGAARSSHLGFQQVEAGGVDITTADVLLSIGRGIGDEEEVPRFAKLADLLGATLSSSRPLVDAGWMSPERQVGQSGKTVKPRVYLSLGISGAVQHLAGMRDAETIIAVNTDPNAPIFGIADYGAVTDLFDLADEIEQILG